MELFELTPSEIITYRKWARANYTPGDSISILWHPTIQEECKVMNFEADEQNSVRNREAIEVEISEWLETFHNTDGDGADYAHTLDEIMKHIQNDRLKNVRHFLITAGSDLPNCPEIPNQDKLKLYFGLILEELLEFAVASGLEGVSVLRELFGIYEDKVFANLIDVQKGKKKIEPNLTECLDALVDLEYVFYNLVNGCGMDKIFHDAHVRVHASNMSKFCTTKEQAVETALMYENGQIKEDEVILCDIDQVGNKFVIRRESDLKILKSKDYYKANLDDLVIEFL